MFTRIASGDIPRPIACGPDRQGEAPAEPQFSHEARLGSSLALHCRAHAIALDIPPTGGWSAVRAVRIVVWQLIVHIESDGNKSNFAMGNRRAQLPPPTACQFDLFPLTAQEWKATIEQLRLTRQQARVVEQILRGLRDKEIAAALKLSEATVRTHLARLFLKLGIDDRVQLVLCVLACRPRPQQE
jgi:DNA-binding CsgD family transcriptional regulator